MLFVIGAMAALSIDVVTLYTARSEAQLAADGAALAGARVLANSGMTSASDTTVGANAVPSAIAVATQVAASNPVGGRNLVPGASPCISGQEICVNINQGITNFIANPQVTVQVQRSDLPTFFARIWGRTTITVKASATAEAYNPSNVPPRTPKLPVAPMCVKPWLLPNLDPTLPVITPPNRIFDPIAGTIENPGRAGVDDCARGTSADSMRHARGQPGLPHEQHTGPVEALSRQSRRLPSTQCVVRGVHRLRWVHTLPVEYCGLRANAYLL